MVRAEDARVVGLGQACVDYLGRVPRFPQEDGKSELQELHKQCGGPASTAMVTLSRLGVACSFLGSVSDDPFGADIIQGLKDQGVDASFLKVLPGYSSQFAFIAISSDSGNRTIFWHRGSVPHLTKDQVDLSPFSRAEILHLDGLMIEASLEAVKQAKSMGLTTVLDAGTMREGSLELASSVDVLIASARFADPLVGHVAKPEEALEALCPLGPRVVIVTLGRSGSLGRDGDKPVRQDAFPVDAVDTTGAGDVYHGGYIYGLLHGWTMKECMRFASAVAALKCREIGARKGIPGLQEVKEFLNTEL
jgi:sulfofructose kinase